MRKQTKTLVRITTVPLSLDKLLTGQLKFMHDNGFDVYMISSPDKNISLIERRESAKFLGVKMSRKISPFQDMISLIKIVFILYKLKPGIVHTHTPKAGLLGMLASWMTNIPVRLHTVAGLPLMEAKGFKRMVLNFTEKLTYRFATKVYCNSNNLLEYIIDKKFIDPQKIRVIGNGSSNGIDTSYFKISEKILNESEDLKKEFAVTNENFVFIYVGRLVKDKGIEELVHAFLNINSSHPNTKLLLVGPLEPLRDPLSLECLDKINSCASIISTGFKDDIHPWLAMSSVLVFPSYREGFPNVPMQAGCFDLPCIVTDINGCNEIIQDEINGLIIPVKNIEALTHAMQRILMDKKLFLKLKLHSREMIIQRFDQKHFWSLLLKEYAP